MNLDKILERGKEKSTYVGLATIVGAIGVMAKINEAPAVAEVLQDAGNSVEVGGFIGVALALISGLVNIFTKSQKK